MKNLVMSLFSHSLEILKKIKRDSPTFWDVVKSFPRPQSQSGQGVASGNYYFPSF